MLLQTVQKVFCFRLRLILKDGQKLSRTQISAFVKAIEKLHLWKMCPVSNLDFSVKTASLNQSPNKNSQVHCPATDTSDVQRRYYVFEYNF